MEHRPHAVAPAGRRATSGRSSAELLDVVEAQRGARRAARRATTRFTSGGCRADPCGAARCPGASHSMHAASAVRRPPRRKCARFAPIERRQLARAPRSITSATSASSAPSEPAGDRGDELLERDLADQRLLERLALGDVGRGDVDALGVEVGAGVALHPAVASRPWHRTRHVDAAAHRHPRAAPASSASTRGRSSGWK